MRAKEKSLVTFGIRTRRHVPFRLDFFFRYKFKSKPREFEPAYGGWYAFAMGQSGEKVS
jgi:hypothetical protein